MKVKKTYEALVGLALRIYNGALAVGEGVGLKHNTAPLIGADLQALVGDPAEPGENGAQGELSRARNDYKIKSVVVVSTECAARQLIATGVDLLRGILGRTSGPGWTNAGFTGAIRSSPRKPLPILLQYRGFLRANPDQQHAVRGFTVERVEAMIAQLGIAYQEQAAAKAVRNTAKLQRDAAQEPLYRRVCDTCRELEQLLDDESGDWYQFGLPRPDDGKIPYVVTGLKLSPGASGEVVARWNASRRAASYRVCKSVAGVEGAAEQVAYTPAREVVLTGLPATTKVVVSVSAVNESGETRVTTAEIVTP